MTYMSNSWLDLEIVISRGVHESEESVFLL